MGHQAGGYPSAQPQPRPSSFDAMGVGSVQAPAPFRAPAPTAVDAEEEFRAVRQSSKMKAIVLAAGTAVVGGLLGFAVGEFDFSRAFQRPTRGWIFGFNLQPGW